MTASEAIKIIKSECYVFNPLNFDRTRIINTALDMAVEALEAQRWFPVSERLPEPSGHHRYLVTEAHFNPEYKARFVEVCEYEARDDDVPPYWDGYCGDNPARVVAWMPLPEPYKEVSNDNT